MPGQPPPQGPLVIVAGLVVLAVLASMLTAWSWALSRLANGRRLLPPPRTRAVPWGFSSLLALLLAWFVVQGVVVSLHFQATGRFGTPPESQADLRAQADGETNTEPAEVNPKPPPWTPRDQLVITASLYALLLPLIPLILRTTSGATLADLGLDTSNLARDVGWGLVAALLLAPVCYGVFWICLQIWKPEEHPVSLMIQQDFSGTTALLALVSAVGLAPLFEEVAFRGVLLPWLERLFSGQPRPARHSSPPPLLPPLELEDADEGALPRSEPSRSPGSQAIIENDREGDQHVTLPPFDSGPKLGGPPELPGTHTDRAQFQANLCVTLLFVALHSAQWPAPVPLIPLSLGLGLLAQRTGRLWSPIALHAAFNGLSTMAMLLALLVGVEPPNEQAIPPPAGSPPASVPRGHTVGGGRDASPDRTEISIQSPAGPIRPD